MNIRHDANADAFAEVHRDRKAGISMPRPEKRPKHATITKQNPNVGQAAMPISALTDIFNPLTLAQKHSGLNPITITFQNVNGRFMDPIVNGNTTSHTGRATYATSLFHKNTLNTTIHGCADTRMNIGDIGELALDLIKQSPPPTPVCSP
jgi:hypothetical protein